LWAWLLDLSGRRTVFLAMFLLQAVIFWLLPSATGLAVFSALNRGGPALLPAAASARAGLCRRYFGAEHCRIDLPG